MGILGVEVDRFNSYEVRLKANSIIEISKSFFSFNSYEVRLKEIIFGMGP